jgi:hypothetical protein
MKTHISLAILSVFSSLLTCGCVSESVRRERQEKGAQMSASFVVFLLVQPMAHFFYLREGRWPDVPSDLVHLSMWNAVDTKVRPLLDRLSFRPHVNGDLIVSIRAEGQPPVEFRVAPPRKDEPPNKALEPTTMAVTPRAIASFDSHVCLASARAAPAMVVAHL